MIVAIVGSRTFLDFGLLTERCDRYLSQTSPEEVTVISGGANGTDSLAEKYAKMKKLAFKVYPADWETHGKSAGMIRNLIMLTECTHVIAFWNGASPGTKNMIIKARIARKVVRVVKI